MTEQPKNPERPASDHPSGDTEAALPATEANASGAGEAHAFGGEVSPNTEVNAPGGEVPADTEVNSAEPESARTAAYTPAPTPDPDAAPTVIAQTPSQAAEDAPTAVTEVRRAPERAPTVVAEAAQAPAAGVAPTPDAAQAPGTKPATPPPEPPPLPPPPEPPPIALDSGHPSTAADRPEIPVAAAFVGGFVLAMILRRLAR